MYINGTEKCVQHDAHAPSKPFQCESSLFSGSESLPNICARYEMKQSERAVVEQVLYKLKANVHLQNSRE